MSKKVYEIQDYTVSINDIEETRKAIIYYNEIGVEATREFYIEGGEILPGYVEKNSVISDQQDPL